MKSGISTHQFGATFASSLLALFCQVAPAAEKATPHKQEAIQKAMSSVATVAEKMKTDVHRPAFHLLPPGNWMNDPNGPLFHDGWYHMFYQHNPYGDNWGQMHWGHFRSRDLVKWEHLPIALWPSEEAGEEHVFSGCAAVNEAGQPMLFYTSIKRGRSAGDFAEQWAAISTDDELIRWEKHSKNPVLAEELHGDQKIWDWRDPFIFKYKDEDYMVLGGNLNKNKGGQAVVTLYKAKSKELTDWEYKGILFTHPDPKVGNIECPNFFELDGQWVLIISPHRRVEYFMGTFDGEKFTAKHQGLMDHSDNYYAPNSMVDEKGRRLLWGWVRGFKGGQGWNGCLTLPRVLKADDRGNLWQLPAPELNALHRRELLNSRKKLPPGEKLTFTSNTPQMEIAAEFVAGNNSGLTLFADEDGGGFRIYYSNGQLTVGDKTMEHFLGVNDPLVLHVFVDHSVIELYANGKLCYTTVHYTDAAPRVEIFTNERNTIVNAAAWELGSIWKN